MEKIISSPGLQHLAEKIFWNLDVEDLKICAQINKACKLIFQNPIFCLRNFEHLSKKNQKDWIRAIQLVKSSDKGIAIISYLKWNLKNAALVDLPCYSSPDVQDEFRKQIWKICKKGKSPDEDIETLKILAPLTDHPNAAITEHEDGVTPLHYAAFNGNTEIVKILAPLTDNPNAPAVNGVTPIHLAAYNGHTDIIKILAPLTKNPNAPDNLEKSPIYCAASNGATEIVKILAPLTDNPNAPDKNGFTPIYWAGKMGYTEIVNILLAARHAEIQRNLEMQS